MDTPGRSPEEAGSSERIPTSGVERSGYSSAIWPVFNLRKSLEMSKDYADKATRNVSEMTGYHRLAKLPDIHRHSLPPGILPCLLNQHPSSRYPTVLYRSTTTCCFTEGQPSIYKRSREAEDTDGGAPSVKCLSGKHEDLSLTLAPMGKVC